MREIDRMNLFSQVVCTLVVLGVAALLTVAICESIDRPLWWLVVLGAVLVFSMFVVWHPAFQDTDYSSISGEETRARGDSWDYCGDPPPDSQDWHSPVDDYYGRHGEFAANDEDRAISEDMQQMRVTNPDVDLEEQYGWENVLNYTSDGYDQEFDDYEEES